MLEHLTGLFNFGFPVHFVPLAVAVERPCLQKRSRDSEIPPTSELNGPKIIKQILALMCNVLYDIRIPYQGEKENNESFGY